MCGIAGIIGSQSQDGYHTVMAMTTMLVHRGPNAGKVSIFPGAVLGHRRLSIIDISSRAAQPMISADGRHAIVYNGEIYNYRELRRNLEDSYSFRSESDTEVLLAAWRRWGEDCLSRINGMFAFCIYDTVEQSAFLARDRFGQKPLFFFEGKSQLIFASEVKALLSVGIEVRPNYEVWARYLTTASYDDTAETLFGGITQLLPGECATYSVATGIKRRHYYLLSDHYQQQSFTENQAADQVRELMVDACRLHMRADVPVGVMLSGGLDSAALLASLDLAGVLSPSVNCFSVDFGSDLSEYAWIESAARHHGLPWKIDSYSSADFLATIRPMMWHQEAPIGGLMNCAFNLVMKAAKGRGYSVLQAGGGPDEAFGGYRNHHNLYLGMLLHSGSLEIEQRLAEYSCNWSVSSDIARRAAEMEISRGNSTIDGTIPIRPETLSLLVSGTPPLSAAPLGFIGDLLRDSQIHYLQGSKIPRNARMLDRLSMAYGIEIRQPFLDHRLVELGLSLSPNHYFLEGRSKGIIRSAFKGVMDDEVRLATKRSIQAPQGLWLRQEPMVSYIENLISSESFASRNMFDVAVCKTLFERFKRGEFDNSFFVWQWINVEEWFRVFVDGDPIADQSRLCSLEELSLT